MSYQLYIGDKTYSSWSLRAWLIFVKFDIDFTEHFVDLGKAPGRDQIAHLIYPRTVPTMITPDGALVTESLAIAEELASLHPNIPMWPVDPAARAVARSITSEMHAGFSALRNEHPMNLRTAFTGVEPSEAVLAEIERLEQLWDWARKTSTGPGPWLFGDFTIADAFYAPIAMRLAGYGLPVSDPAKAIVETHLNDPHIREWRRIGLTQGRELKRYWQTWEKTDWPGPD